MLHFFSFPAPATLRLAVLSQAFHQEQVAVGVVGTEPLSVFLKQPLPGTVLAARMQLADAATHLRQP